MDATNLLLSTDGLPAFDRIRPEHITPAVDVLLAAANDALARATSDAVPADYDALSAVLDVATERLGRAWGCVHHLKRRRRYARAADRLHAEPAARHRVPYPPGRRRRPVRQVQGDRQRPDGRDPQRTAGARRSPTRCATSCSRARSCRARPDSASPKLQELQADLSQQFSEHVLDATDGTAIYVDEAELDGVPDDAKQAARAAALSEGRDGCKITLHYPSYFPVMQYGRNRDVARTPVHRLRHARERARQARARQQRGDAPAAGAAPGRGPAAGQAQLRRGFARAQDGRVAAAGHGLPARPRPARPPRRRTRPGRTACLRARRTRPVGPAGLGHAVRERAPQGAALRLQRPGGEAVLHRDQSARGLVPHRRDLVRRVHPARRGDGVAPERALLPHRTAERCGRRRAGLAGRASSGSTPMRARASDPARGWTTCASAGHGPKAGCRRRSRTSSATSRRRSTASRRC